MGAVFQSLRRRSWPLLLSAVAVPLTMAGSGVVGTPAAHHPGAAQSVTAVTGAGGLSSPGGPHPPPSDPLTVGYPGTGEGPLGDGAAEALLAAYRSAVTAVPAACHLSVSLLAAIGQAESGPLGGARSGSRTAQDAARTTARSLCAQLRDLSHPEDLRAALLARNDSHAFVRLVLTLTARYDLVGLGLVGAPGPVLVPLLLEQATALVADPYGPAVVYPSRKRGDGGAGRVTTFPAEVGARTKVSDSRATRTSPEPATVESAAVGTSDPPVRVTPAGQPVGDEAAASTEPDAQPDPEPDSATPDPDPAPEPEPASATPDPDPAPEPEPASPSTESGTEVAATSCPAGATGGTPDAGASSDSPVTDVAEGTTTGSGTGGGEACATETTPETAATAEPDPAGDAPATTTGPEPGPGTEPALP